MRSLKKIFHTRIHFKGLAMKVNLLGVPEPFSLMEHYNKRIAIFCRS